MTRAIGWALDRAETFWVEIDTIAAQTSATVERILIMQTPRKILDRGPQAAAPHPNARKARPLGYSRPGYIYRINAVYRVISAQTMGRTCNLTGVENGESPAGGGDFQ